MERMGPISVVLAVMLVLLAVPAQADVPYLVKNINILPADSAPESYVDAGAIAFFTAYDYVHGRELWLSDATSEGTYLVKDIWPGSCTSGSNLVSVNGVVFYAPWDAAHGSELWKSDGTQQGTVLVKDIWPGWWGSYPHSLVNLEGTLYFWASDGIHGWELWRSDGTEQGTVLVRDVNVGPGDSYCYRPKATSVNGVLYFAGNDGIHGAELWRSDGTEDGTVLVKDICPGPEGSLAYYAASLINVDGLLFLTADDGIHGVELWRSNGTEEGTVLVKDIRAGSEGCISPRAYMADVDGTLFLAADDGVTGRELWLSDGSEAGTVLVKDFVPGEFGSYPYGLTAVNGSLLFFADQGGFGHELCKSDGTEQGTVLVKDINPGIWSCVHSPSSDIVAVGGIAFFRAMDEASGYELWKSDGTEAGTVLVRDICPGPEGSLDDYYGSKFAAVAGKLFFGADHGAHGIEPWVSDGTETGTLLLGDINCALDGASPRELTPAIGLLFFTANAEGDDYREFWVSDGTAPGTTTFGVEAGLGITSGLRFVELGGRVLFPAYERDHGGELWSTDGTEAGTSLVKDIVAGMSSSSPRGLVLSNETLFFAAETDCGKELWKSDGSEAGTTLVKDINPGPEDSMDERGFHSLDVDGTLFFAADDGIHGAELWTSRGNSFDTLLVRDINPGPDDAFDDFIWSFDNALLAYLDGVVFFAADDGEHGEELWKSDGTESGTVLVKDIYPGPQGTLYSQDHMQAVVFNGMFLFAVHDGTHGRELWRSDGTEAGTVLVKDIWPGPEGSEPLWLTPFNGALYFSARDGVHGHELWVTDGTSAGTVLFQDIWPGPLRSSPWELTQSETALLFTASDGTWGDELWRSNGTAQGTYRVSDIAPGWVDASPYHLTLLGNRLFFVANDSFTGCELWALDLPPPQAGDLNLDGCVDHTDLGILLGDWGCSGGDCVGDCDGDGDTDHEDLAILLAHWGEGCP